MGEKEKEGNSLGTQEGRNRGGSEKKWVRKEEGPRIFGASEERGYLGNEITKKKEKFSN